MYIQLYLGAQMKLQTNCKTYYGNCKQLLSICTSIPYNCIHIDVYNIMNYRYLYIHILYVYI